MELHWCFSLGGFYGMLQSLALWDLTIALVLLIGGEVDGGEGRESMEFFHA